MSPHGVSLRLVLFSKARKDGSKTVALRVTHRRKVRHCDSSQWDAAACRFTKAYPDHKRENDMLRTYEQRAADAVRAMERDAVPFTFERIERAVFGDAQAGGAMQVVKWLRTLSAELETRGRYGNSRIYHYTANALEGFRPTGGRRAPAFDAGALRELAAAVSTLNALLSRGIVAVVPDRTITDINDRFKEINEASGGFFS